jgi:hypothetical protein
MSADSRSRPGESAIISARSSERFHQGIPFGPLRTGAEAVQFAGCIFNSGSECGLRLSRLTSLTRVDLAPRRLNLNSAYYGGA